MTEHCPTCGAAVTVVSDCEGTCHYEPTDEAATLRAERDELRERVDRLANGLAREVQARLDAERERDEWREKYESALTLADDWMGRAETAEATLRAERDSLQTDLKLNASMLARQTDEARQAEIERDAAVRRAEQAERERDDIEQQRGLLEDLADEWQHRYREAESKCSDLTTKCSELQTRCEQYEAALREAEREVARLQRLKEVAVLWSMASRAHDELRCFASGVGELSARNVLLEAIAALAGQPKEPPC